MAYLYGDMLKIDTTGASEVTAKQYKLTLMGENIDLARIEKYKSTIIKVGSTKQMDPAVIAAIISRESRAGTFLYQQEISVKFPNWTQEQCFKGKIEVHHLTLKSQLWYNVCFRGNISGDYSNDVVARAQWFKSKG
uniref:Uncharacterized protein n=1 Tax=Cyprinus carpio TaxID=7962 RepID=A0A8C1LZA8_CYPCA